MNLERKTWELGRASAGDKVMHLPLSHPPASIDEKEALAHLYARKQSGDSRYDAVSSFVKAATSFFLQSAQQAIVEMAYLGVQQGLRPANGWIPTVQQSNNTFTLTVEREGAPGAWCFEIACQKEQTPEGTALISELREQVHKENKDLGHGRHRDIMIAIGSVTDLSDLEMRYKNAQEDPANYRPAASGDRLDLMKISAHSQNGGVPDGVDPLYQGDTKQGELSPSFEDRETLEKRGLSPISGGLGGAVEHGLFALSRLLEANGFSEMVAAKAASISMFPWTCYSERSAEITDAAHAVVSGSGGLFDQSVMDQIRGFSNHIASKSFERISEKLVELSEGLIARGHTDQSSCFEANDMREHVYVEQTETGYLINLRNDIATYHVDLQIDDGVVMGLEVSKVEGDSLKPVARFTGPEFTPDFGDYETGIPYDLRTVRDTNGVHLGLDSVHCCMIEDYGPLQPPEEDDAPSM